MIRKGREEDLSQLRALRDETLTMRGVSTDEAKLAPVYRRAFDGMTNVSACSFISGMACQAVASSARFRNTFFRANSTYPIYLYAGLMGGLIVRRLFECSREAAVREIRTGASAGTEMEAAHRFYTAMVMIHLSGLYSLVTDGARR